MGFDLGAFVANLLLSHFSRPGDGNVALETIEVKEKRIVSLVFLLELCVALSRQSFWAIFQKSFLDLWQDKHSSRSNNNQALYSLTMFPSWQEVPSGDFMLGLLQDTLGFAGCKIIRFGDIPLERVASSSITKHTHSHTQEDRWCCPCGRHGEHRRCTSACKVRVCCGCFCTEIDHGERVHCEHECCARVFAKERSMTQQ